MARKLIFSPLKYVNKSKFDNKKKIFPGMCKQSDKGINLKKQTSFFAGVDLKVLKKQMSLHPI